MIVFLSLIHISEPTRPERISYAVFCLKKKKNVIEKTPLVTRIKTPKNEVVTIPNSFIMSSHTVN
ncbi:mechanosensitive ion channel family protein, partial [Bacteroides fragilis]